MYGPVLHWLFWSFSTAYRKGRWCLLMTIGYPTLLIEIRGLIPDNHLFLRSTRTSREAHPFVVDCAVNRTRHYRENSFFARTARLWNDFLQKFFPSVTIMISFNQMSTMSTTPSFHLPITYFPKLVQCTAWIGVIPECWLKKSNIYCQKTNLIVKTYCSVRLRIYAQAEKLTITSVHVCYVTQLFRSLADTDPTFQKKCMSNFLYTVICKMNFHLKFLEVWPSG